MSYPPLRQGYAVTSRTGSPDLQTHRTHAPKFAESDWQETAQSPRGTEFTQALLSEKDDTGV